LDLISRKLLMLETIKIAVLDEADRMLDIGFRPDIEKILRRCPTERQTLLLSATLPAPVERLAQKFMRSPVRVDLSKDQIAVDAIDQFYVTVDHDRKLRSLAQLLIQERPNQAIVFCRTKRGADNLHRKLSFRLPGVSVIHGDLQQTVRDRAMRQFREGTTRLLIATDVVGRGIDVSAISHIINYDIPEDPEAYVHRIGRTARMGASGKAFTFVSKDQGGELTKVEALINMVIPPATLEGWIPSPTPADWTDEKPGFGTGLPSKPIVNRYDRAYNPSGITASEAPAAEGTEEAPTAAPMVLPTRTIGSKIPINRRHKRRR
ncbi:MAG TPA: DEAD/DEAH box helicase, partial [Humisphaera sp.]|nr:DEAD/DEAH box helicase [Humisphaera sp.]